MCTAFQCRCLSSRMLFNCGSQRSHGRCAPRTAERRGPVRSARRPRPRKSQCRMRVYGTVRCEGRPPLTSLSPVSGGGTGPSSGRATISTSYHRHHGATLRPHSHSATTQQESQLVRRHDCLWNTDPFYPASYKHGGQPDRSELVISGVVVPSVPSGGTDSHVDREPGVDACAMTALTCAEPMSSSQPRGLLLQRRKPPRLRFLLR